MISFSVAGPGFNEPSYAFFGGFNPEQVVGGSDGIRKMATMGYRINSDAKKNWALRGESLFYGDDEIVALRSEKDTAYPALIDTGSQNIAVP